MRQYGRTARGVGRDIKTVSRLGCLQNTSDLKAEKVGSAIIIFLGNFELPFPVHNFDFQQIKMTLN